MYHYDSQPQGACYNYDGAATATAAAAAATSTTTTTTSTNTETCGVPPIFLPVEQGPRYFKLQQVFGSPTGNMIAYDEVGREVYKFRGKWITALDSVKIEQRSTGLVIGTIRERATARKIINKPKYEILTANSAIRLRKDVFAFIKDNFTLNVYQGDRKTKVHVTSNWTSWNWTFSVDGECVAVVRKRFLNWTDTYEVEVQRPWLLDSLLVLAMAVVIDRVCYGELTLKGFVNVSVHLPQNPFARFPISHAQW